MQSYDDLMLKVKICGLTRAEDALAAWEAGADWIGLNIFSGPRQITLPQAAAILRMLPDIKPVVALVDLSTQDGFAAALELAVTHQVRTFQVYGELKNLRALPVKAVDYWPVFRIARRADLREIAERLKTCAIPAAAIVIDAFSTRGHGGTGTSIDLSWLLAAQRAGEWRGLPPIMLAGGLKPENIAHVLAELRPWAVDVAGGVEAAGEPGIKDHARMRAFVQAVRSAVEGYGL